VEVLEMSRTHLAGRAARFSLALLVTLVACGEDGTDIQLDEDFVGNWGLTSFVLDGVELVTPESDFYVSLGLFEDSSYQLIVGGDVTHVICLDTTSCVESGDFSYTGTIFTLDPGEASQILLEYSVSGDVLTLSGDSALGEYTAVLERL
jgi:hypothetical protein